MTSLIAGRKPVIEALRAGTPIARILLLHGTQGPVIEEIKSLAKKHNIRLQEVDKERFSATVNDIHAQGVAAITPERKLAQQRKEKGFILILDEIEDQHNLGALIRTAECAGVHGVILPKHHSAPVTATVVKSSAGATEHIAIAEVTNIVNSLKELKEEGFWVVGLDAGGDKLYTGIDYSTPTVLVVGSEGKGLRRLVKEHCDFLVKIPLHGKIQSLNASVAGALVMFEAAKQRQK
jgi:23S rRNA (guanosine2251-2'-O)-methyltransferase